MPGSFNYSTLNYGASLVAQLVKNPPAVWEAGVQSLGWEDSLEEEMTTYSSILAQRIPWTEEPGWLQSMGSQNQTGLSNSTTNPYNKLHQSASLVTLPLMVSQGYCPTKIDFLNQDKDNYLTTKLLILLIYSCCCDQN